MAELLLELFCEEIPARMQARAAQDLQRLISDGLKAAGLPFETVKTFVTPRRLCLVVDGLPLAQPDREEERKGPRTDAPEAAVQGFLASTGLRLEQLQKRESGKGEFYFAVTASKGRPAGQVIPDLVEKCVREFPWPKSMRWGAGSLRWVRPLHSILCLFDGAPLKFAIDGVQASDTTRGHRFMAPDSIRVRNFTEYRGALEKAFVCLDPADRKARILQQAEALAAADGLELIPDEALLDEVAGLNEWPTALMGKFDEAFLEVPPEVLRTAMRTHQKYFSLRGKDGKFAPRFIVVANLLAADGGKKITEGNQRVLAARLSDAKFFWDQDRKQTLESRLDGLKDMVFHAKLGSVYDKMGRMRVLASYIYEHTYEKSKRLEFAKSTTLDVVDMEFISNWSRKFPYSVSELNETLFKNFGEDRKQDYLERESKEESEVSVAASLCKADLTTGMVAEFPELQGLMGYYYALNDGLSPLVASAIKEHYSPQGPSDQCPVQRISVTASMADKIDTMVGFFAVREIPSGSRDPYALRRAAIGIIRLILENNLRVNLTELFIFSSRNYNWGLREGSGTNALEEIYDASHRSSAEIGSRNTQLHIAVDVSQKLLAFFADRLKVHLRERGMRHDLVDAVFALGGQDDLVLLVARAGALDVFVRSDDGANLLAAYKRAVNILRIEEKRDGKSYDRHADPAGFRQDEERALFDRISDVADEADDAVRREDFTAAMTAMARLRGPVDAFFDKVTVNADDAELRVNRLLLLSQIRATLETVADFSKIEG